MVRYLKSMHDLGGLVIWPKPAFGNFCTASYLKSPPPFLLHIHYSFDLWLSKMKVILIIFLSLCHTFEPTESHGLHSWVMFSLKNFVRQQKLRSMETTVGVSKSDDKSGDDINVTKAPKTKSCNELPAWTSLWYLYGCNIYDIRRSRFI